jgi:hypothetical protein
VRGVLIAAFVSLAAGVGVLFVFCHGTTGIQFAYPFSAASVHVDITTTGMPGILGFILTVSGAFLLIIATILALIDLFRHTGGHGAVKRRESAFEE